MGSFQARKKNQSGVALFIVLAAMSVLSIMVTEFVYVGAVNKRIAYEGLDQLKAYYLAKSGLKISLLRLKAYQIIKDFMKSNGMQDGVPTSVLEKVWSFPLIYPIPSDLPGLSSTQKESIDKFTKESNLEGSYSAIIESESSKYNLNSILQSYAYAMPSPSPSPPNSNGNSNANDTDLAKNNTPNPNPSPTPTFNIDIARQSLQDYISQLLYTKFRDDRDFADLYRDLRVEDLMDSIVSWSDNTYDARRPRRDEITVKRAPFYSLSELRMLPEVDDTLYDLLSGALTCSITPGIHINSMKSETLSALVPQLTKDENAAFFKFRDAQDKNNAFAKVDDFFSWLGDNASAFRSNSNAIADLKKSIEQRNIQLLVEEKTFRITVTARVGGSSKVLQVWAQFDESDAKDGTAGPTVGPPTPASSSGTLQVGPDGLVMRGQTGLKVTFMRIF